MSPRGPREDPARPPAAIERLARVAGVPRPGESLPGNAPMQAAAPPPGRAPGRGRRRARRGAVIRRSLRACVAEGAVAEVFAACAGGAVLTAWALQLGATPAILGLLAALPFASQVLQFPAAWLTRRFGARAVAVTAIAGSRLVWLPMAALPLLDLGAGTQLPLFTAVVALAAVFAVVGNNAWTSWVAALVPDGIRGRFFGQRTIWITAAGTAASLAVGVGLDMLPNARRAEALAAVAALACVAGLVSVLLLVRQHHPGEPEAVTEPDWRQLRSALGDADVRSLLGYQLAWNAAVGISAGFFAYHMLGYLRTGLALAAMHGVVVAAVRIASAPLWGRAVDAVGARPVLVVCSAGIAAIPALWLFASPVFLWPIALEAVVAGALWGGHGIAAMDATMRLSQGRARPYHVAVVAAGGGLAFAAASLAAGVLATHVPERFTALGEEWVAVHVLFLASALARAAAAGAALRIAEPGARPAGALIRLIGAGIAGHAALRLAGRWGPLRRASR
jgi:MFS family permease